MHGETVLLMDGNKRHIRKDGLVCVTIVKAKDGTSAIDADFRLEQALLVKCQKRRSCLGSLRQSLLSMMIRKP